MQSIPPSELIEMDQTYLSQITTRKAIMNDHPDLVLGATEPARAAIREVYTWLLSDYLPVRFPMIFQTMEGSTGCRSVQLLNSATGDVFPVTPPQSSLEALKAIGQLVDEDMFFLLPSPDGDSYVVQAFLNCFANGPSTKSRLQKKLRQVHGGVPGYQERLAAKMDSHFENLKVGNYAKRENWTVSDSADMFFPQHHIPFEGRDESTADLDLDQVYLRCERQTLYRLPKSLAILFSVKTYQYPIKDIKQEGLGLEFAQAVEGLQAGSTPAIFDYKRGAYWAKPVMEFMRQD